MPSLLPDYSQQASMWPKSNQLTSLPSFLHHNEAKGGILYNSVWLGSLHNQSTWPRTYSPLANQSWFYLLFICSFKMQHAFFTRKIILVSKLNPALIAIFVFFCSVNCNSDPNIENLQKALLSTGFRFLAEKCNKGNFKNPTVETKPNREWSPT